MERGRFEREREVGGCSDAEVVSTGRHTSVRRESVFIDQQKEGREKVCEVSIQQTQT